MIDNAAGGLDAETEAEAATTARAGGERVRAAGLDAVIRTLRADPSV